MAKTKMDRLKEARAKREAELAKKNEKSGAAASSAASSSSGARVKPASYFTATKPKIDKVTEARTKREAEMARDKRREAWKRFWDGDQTTPTSGRTFSGFSEEVKSYTPKESVKAPSYAEMRAEQNAMRNANKPKSAADRAMDRLMGESEETEKPTVTKPGSKPTKAGTKPASAWEAFNAWDEDEDDLDGVDEAEYDTKPAVEDPRKKEVERLQSEKAALQSQYETLYQSVMWSDDAEGWAELRELQKQIWDYDDQIAEAGKPIDWEGRQELIDRLNEIDNNSGYITNEREAQAVAAERADIIYQLEKGDAEAGNGFQSYGDVDRARQVVSGAAGQYVSGVINAAGTALDAAYSGVNTNPYAGWAQDPLSAESIGYEHDEDQMGDYAFVKSGSEALKAAADNISTAAAADLESAKAGLGTLGSAGVDIATNVIQMGFDAALGKIPGFGALGAMFVRSFGSSAQEARLDGADINQQIPYAFVKAGIEIATEKMFDGVAGIYGKGDFDEVVEGVIRHLAESDTGRTVARAIAGAIEEGGEEVVSDIFGPLAEAIRNDDTLYSLFFDESGRLFKGSYSLNGSEVLYDFLIGAAIGGLGGGTSIVTGQDAVKNAEAREADEVEARVNEQMNGVMDALAGRSPYTTARPGMENTMISDAGTGTPVDARSFAEEVVQGQNRQDAAFGNVGLAGEARMQPDSGTGTAAQPIQEDAAATNATQATTEAAKAPLRVTPQVHAGEQQTASKSPARVTPRVHTDTQQTAMTPAQRTVRDAVESLGVSEAEAEILTDGLNIGKADAQTYANGIREVYNYAKMGLSAEQVRQQSVFAEQLTEPQFRHAFDLGAQKAPQAKQNATTAKAPAGKVAPGTEAYENVNEKLNPLGEYSEEAANVYEAGQDVATYSAAMSEATVLAANGVDIGPVIQQARERGGALGILTDAQVETARQIGAKMAADQRGAVARSEARNKAAREKAGNGKPQKGRMRLADTTGTVGGVQYKPVRAKDLSKTQKAVVKLGQYIAEKTGLDIRIADFGRIQDTGYGIGGEYFRGAGGVLYLNINATTFDGANISAGSLFHELTHWLQEYAPSDYTTLKQVIVQEFARNPAAFSDIFRQRAASQPNLKADEISDEMVANACQTLFSDPDSIQRFVNENRNLAEKIWDFIKRFIDDLKAAFSEIDTKSSFPLYKEVRAAEGALDEIRDAWLKAFDTATENLQAEKAQGSKKAATKGGVQNQAWENESTEIGDIDLKDYKAAKGTDGKPLFQVYAFEHDEAEYREMLTKWGGMSTQQVDDLFKLVDAAMDKIKGNLEALDYAWEADIDDRSFMPVKQNSDKLYKVSQDFSTLCRKRILQGVVSGQLSASLQRGLTKEEGIAVRDALIAIQQEGKQIEVACALCYVESARMRSQKAIQEFLNDPAASIQNYFAGKSGSEATKAAEAAERQKIWEEYGMVRGKGDDETMYDIRDTKTATMAKIPTNLKKRIQDAKKAAKKNIPLTPEQQRTVEKAKSLPVTAFTTPEGLQDLAKNSDTRDIFNAFVLKVSAASKSKGIENDTWWRAGDSKAIGDALIQQMNAENGLRTQSWSDFQVKHLMDYIAATIELSTRGAQQHAYTKVLDYVELMGNTGVMINMSLIPTREFSGKLEYDNVEGFVYEDAMRMREKFPDTAGTICIGMDDEQVRQLLASTDIDYVIPYHQSGMSKATRAAMHIPAWKDFQNYQGEKKLNRSEAKANAEKYGVELLSEDDPNWHESPNFSDWYDQKTAEQDATLAGKSGEYGVMTGGYTAMQNAAENYKRICAERGLMPKFSYGKADFSNEANYWKLLIDRKMVNNQTGDIIEQKPLKPIFDFDTVQRILNDELERYGTVKADQEEAIERVTQAFLSGKVKGGMSSDAIAKAMQKPVDNVPIVNITENAAQMQVFEDKAESVKDAALEDNEPAVAETNVQFSIWEGEPPKKTQYGFKLMTVKKVGDQWLPTAMFIDRANPYEFGQWYKADSPKLENLIHLEPGYSYLIDENDNADMETRRPFKKTTRVNKKGQKTTSYSQLPSVGDIDKATLDGKRWMLVDRYADGGVNIQNLGVNGSGSVSKFALRPGIHAVDIPSMAHIGAVDNENGGKKRRTNERWFLIEYPVDVDYNQEAYSHESKDIRDHLPTGGWYSYQTNSGAEARQHWFITGGMKIVGAVSEADVRKYAKDRGFEQDLQWRDGKVYSEDDAIDLDEYLRTTTAQPTPSKAEMRQRIESDRAPRFQTWDTSHVPQDVSDFVDKALSNKRSNDSITITLASKWDNKAINKLGRTWQGKYAGSERTIDGEYARHVINQHGDPITEALRGQLYMDADAIKIAISKLRNGEGRVIDGTFSKRNMPTVLTQIPINGYTLYAEEPILLRDKTELQGRTMYMTPTSTAALVQGNRPVNIPQRRSGGPIQSIDLSSRIVNGYLADKPGNKERLSFVQDAAGNPFTSLGMQSLYAMSTDPDTLKKYATAGRTIGEANVKVANPYYVTMSNPLITSADVEDGTILDRLSELRDAGYDSIVMDYKPGDNYMVMVFDRSQIEKVQLQTWDEGRDVTETKQFKRWFKGSKVVNEDGSPMVVYHGTEADFTVFDRTKGRATMDIQGMFFSPWEIEAGGYGSKVGAYYLSIKNPAPEGLAYKALNMYKGQNNAGIKAREYLEKLGYDGVQNYDEWIAFRPEQIKSATNNIGTFDPNNPDVRFQTWDEGPVYNNRALVSEETVDKWLSGGWFGSNTNPNYAQAYIAYMRPDQYLRLSTIYDEGRIQQESEGRTMDWVKDASEGQPIQLKIDTAEGKVYDHEGRHRMVVLSRNGVRHVPVLLFDMDTKYSKESLAELKLEGQNFNGVRNYATTTVEDLVPLNKAHREEILEKFSKKTSFEKISEKYDRYQTFQFQQWDNPGDDDTGAVLSSPNGIAPVNEVSDPEKYHYLVDEFRRNGYRGRPIVAVGTEGNAIALTGSHRLLAAREAGIDVPVVYIPYDIGNPLLQKLLEAGGDDYRAEAAQELFDAGMIDQSTLNLIKREEELNWENYDVPFDEQARFQRWDNPGDDTTSEKQGRQHGYARLQSENAILGQTVKELKRLSKKQNTTIAKLQNQMRITKTPEVRENDARKLAKALIAETGSEADVKAVTGGIKALGDYLLNTNAGDIDEKTLKGRARAIANEILGSATADMTFDDETMEVNPYEVYMGEAVEEMANRIVMDAMSGVLRPTAPTKADRQKARTQALREQIQTLKAEKKLGTKEAASLYNTIYDLSLALDKAESRYETLRQEADYRSAQLRAEGAARAAEIRANERARAANLLQSQKAHYLDIARRAKERREESAGVTKYRKQVEQKAKKLYEMLLTNSNDLHVPEVLKGPLGEFLESLDFTSKRQLAGGPETRADEKFGARLMRLQQMLANQQSYINGDESVQSDLGGYIDVSPEILDYLRQMSEMITTAMNMGRTFTINQMSAADLKVLSDFLSNLRTAIRNMNSFMANARYESVREAANADIDHMKALGRAAESEGSNLAKFTTWENGVPYYIFKRFGEGGKAIFDGFTKGWEKMAMNAQEIIAFTEKLYTDKEVRKWKTETHDITLEDGSKIRMTTAQIMELSQLLGREQALRHIGAGGIRVGDIKTKMGKISDTTHHHLTDGDIKAITGLLNNRQLAVAKAMQQFMAKRGAEWGNEISMRRFGYNFYTEGEGYYPIKTDANDRPMADTDAQTNSMFRLLNLSSSKSLNPKASNALIVGDIFDTFSDHMADMAKLNGMGLPILDAIKWFNYKERIDRDDGTYDTKTLQGAMEQAFGGNAGHYFRTLMKDINGQTETGDRGMGIGSKLLSNYKAAAVGANLRVAMLQPTSYVRALTVLKPQYLAGAFAHRNAYKEAMQYSGTAVWKSLGYYDTDISKSMRGQIEHDDTWRDKIVEKSMALAELGDKRTWGRLWVACKMQTKAETGLEGEELKKATADLFREVIYSSQVMDATLTRSEIMRGKGVFSKMSSAFMAEPTLSYNILLDAVSQYDLDARKNGKASAWKHSSGKLGKAFIVYLNSAAFSAMVESLADAARDDDDDEFWDKFLQAFLGEDDKGNAQFNYKGNFMQDLSILGKLPIIKNWISNAQGYNSGDMTLAALSNGVKAFQIWQETYKLATGELDKATAVTYYGNMTQWGKIYKTMQALSQLSGLPAANAARDAIAIWNNVIGDRKPDWKIRTYDSKKNQVFRESVAPSGVSYRTYNNILADADTDGSGLSQVELSTELTNAIARGDITEAQAEAIWNAKYDKKTFAQGKESAAKAKAEAEKEAADPDYARFKTDAPVYSTKTEATYNAWKETVKPLGVSMDTYISILNAANTDGNTTVKQDEMGDYLVKAIRRGELTEAQADAIWRTHWNSKNTFAAWRKKH